MSCAPCIRDGISELAIMHEVAMRIPFHEDRRRNWGSAALLKMYAKVALSVLAQHEESGNVPGEVWNAIVRHKLEIGKRYKQALDHRTGDSGDSDSSDSSDSSDTSYYSAN